MALKDRIIEIAYELKDRFSGRTRKVTSSIRDIGAQSDKTTGKLERNNTRTIRSFSGLSSHLTKVKLGFLSVFGAVAGGFGIGALIETNREAERLRASLVTVTGGAREAKQAWDLIKQFARETPFELNQVVESYIKLKSLGLDPSTEALRSYGNTASAMGKDLNQFIEAVADATTGEFERLKEFGIKASKEGERITFTFRGAKTEVGNNAREIEGFLRRLGEQEFAGGMERQTKTLGGAISNLKDSWNTFLDTVLSDESSGALSRFIGGLTAQFNNLSKAIAPKDVATLESELAKLEQRLESRGHGRGGQGGLKRRIEALKDEIIQAKVAAGDVGGINQAISQIDQQISSLEEKLNQVPDKIQGRTGRSRGALTKAADRIKAQLIELKKEREALQKTLQGIETTKQDGNTTLLEGAKGQSDLIKKRIEQMRKDLETAKDQYDAVVDEFQNRLDTLKAPDQKPDEELNVLDADKGIREAERELRAGNFDRAIEKARQAFDVLDRMKKAGVESEQIIEHFGERLQEVAEKAQADKLADITAQIEIDEAKAAQSLEEAQGKMQAQANANPIEQPVVTKLVDGIPNGGQPQILVSEDGNSFTDEPQPGFQPIPAPPTPEEMIQKVRLDTTEADRDLEDFQRRASQPIERKIYTNEVGNSFSDRDDFGRALTLEALGKGSRR